MSEVIHRTEYSCNCQGCGWRLARWVSMDALKRHVEYHERHCENPQLEVIENE